MFLGTNGNQLLTGADFNVKWVQKLLETATPQAKSDEFRDFIEETGYSLSKASLSNLCSLIPTILDKHLEELLQPLELIADKVFFSVISDGTSQVAEAFGIVIR